MLIILGADLIAQKNGKRFAISVKTRLFRERSKESRGVPIEYDNLRKLEDFSKRFAMVSIFAQVICMADEKAIYLFMIPVSRISNTFHKRKHGYSLLFGKKHINSLTQSGNIDYSCWQAENIGGKDFDV